MNIASHIEKMKRLESARDRLRPDVDFELWFWATMNAGTHVVNAALHAVGATDAGDYFPTQPGLYLVSDGGGRFTAEFRRLGDVLHVGRPRVNSPVPPQIAQMMAAMEIIEGHRDPCIRGAREPTPDIVAECNRAYEECKSWAGKLLDLS